MLDLKSQGFKTLEELRETTPSIFTKTSSDSTSDKYTHIPTDTVIKDMELLGWGVVDAKEVKARKASTLGFQKHLVVFRNPEIFIDNAVGDKVYPQVLLTNSHDGKNSFTFTAGLFRMVCENGLVVATETFDAIRVRHLGYDFLQLKITIEEMLDNIPLAVECMNRMKHTELKSEQAFDLAKSFLEIRVKDSGNTFDAQAIDDILQPQRNEDEGLGLWEVFNRIQENIIEGNFQYITHKGKSRQARVIKNFKQDQDLNKKLFNKALEYAS